MEDFLDHNYGSMLDAELSRRQKKPETINHEKPALKIGEEKEENNVLARLWEF
jgi:hypothetical protein